MWDWDSGHLGEGLESLTPQRVLSKACSHTVGGILPCGDGDKEAAPSSAQQACLFGCGVWEDPALGSWAAGVQLQGGAHPQAPPSGSSLLHAHHSPLPQLPSQ